MGALVLHSSFLGFGFRITGASVRTLKQTGPRRLPSRQSHPPRSVSFPVRCDSSSAFQTPQDTVLEALSEAAKAEGRTVKTTNVIMGGTVTGASDDEWRTLNEKVNSYPTSVNFTAIGSGGDDFVQAMVSAVESVLQSPILEDEVKLSLSSKGKYVSVRIGPVEVDSSDQVQAVYRAMKKDERMKYFL